VTVRGDSCQNQISLIGAGQVPVGDGRRTIEDTTATSAPTVVLCSHPPSSKKSTDRGPNQQSSAKESSSLGAMRRPVAPAVLLLLLLALSATQQPIAAATGGRPRTSDESDTDPNKGVHTTTTVAGVCGEGQHVTVPMVHEFDGVATVLDAELRASVNGTTDLVSALFHPPPLFARF
jgi:hypothetical protein